MHYKRNTSISVMSSTLKVIVVLSSVWVDPMFTPVSDLEADEYVPLPKGDVQEEGSCSTSHFMILISPTLTTRRSRYHVHGWSLAKPKKTEITEKLRAKSTKL